MTRHHTPLLALGVLVVLLQGLVVGCGAAVRPSPVLPAASPVPSAAPSGRAPAANAPPQQRQPPVLPSPTPGTDAVTRGRQLYGAGCAGCHGQAGQGTGQAPSLLGAGPATVDWWVASGRMPLSRVQDQPERRPPVYTRDEIDDLITYVDSLAPGGEPVPQLPAGNLQSGRNLYLLNCASCHTATGVGAALPAGQVAPSVLGVPATQVAEAIRIGPGLMPQFPATVLSDQQTADVVTYVSYLSDAQSHGGWRIGAVGPVAEGLVAWGLGLVLLLIVIRLLGKQAPS